MNENELANIIVDTAFQIHKNVGPGLLESVYEIILYGELKKKKINVERQRPIPIIYQEYEFIEGFRADLIVEDKIIIELKSVERIDKVHKKQLLTYLKLADKKLGLLINFGSAFFKDGIFRVVNNLQE